MLQTRQNHEPFDTHELLEGIRSWVEIESPTTDVASVNRMIDKIEAEAVAAGARVHRIAGTEGYGDHLLLSSPWGDEDPGILLLAHIDTVHPIGTLAGPLPYRVEEGAAFGPGIYDMKGGAYLAFAAFRKLISKGWNGALPVRCLFIADEEVGSPTGRAHIEREARRARYVLVTEPMSEGRITSARKGVARLKMSVTGQPAHSGGRHQDGRSAIRELAHQVLKLEAMTDYSTGLTVNVGVFHGGTRANVVPGEAVVEIDVRFTSVEAGEEVVSAIKGLKPCYPDVKLAVTGGITRPAFEKSAEAAALLDLVREEALKIGFTKLEDYASGGGSDGNFTASIAPTLDGLGVDGKGPHTHYEQLKISSLVPNATLLLRLLEALK